MSLIRADARQIPLVDGCVQCCVTSPPYWGLRDYGTAQWDGGDPECGHVELAVGMSGKNTLGPDRYLPPTNAANIGRTRQYRSICGKCGARRIDKQIGLEPAPDCGRRGMLKIRADLTEAQRAFVVQRLQALGLI